MPLYDYEVTDPDTGEVLAVLSVMRPIPKRDTITLTRRTVPNRVAIPGTAEHPVLGRNLSFKDCEKKGIAAMEAKHGSRFKLGTFSKRQLQEIHS